MTERGSRETSGTSRGSHAQLKTFIAKYSPAVAAEGRAVLAKVRRLVPSATQLVYDNFRWLVVGFSPTERPSDAVLSVVFTPRWITLCFLQNGPRLPDPDRLLRGSGKQVRSLRLSSSGDLEAPPVRALIAAALSRARVPFAGTARGGIVVRAISKKQLPRRPEV